MEVQLKDESGKSVESLLEKSIALTNEVQVNPSLESSEVLKEIEIDLPPVPEHKELKTNPPTGENPSQEKDENVPVQKKIVDVMNSALEAVVETVKGAVDSVTKKESTDEIKLVKDEGLTSSVPVTETMKIQSVESKETKEDENKQNTNVLSEQMTNVTNTLQNIVGNIGATETKNLEEPATETNPTQKKESESKENSNDASPKSILSGAVDNAKQLLQDATLRMEGTVGELGTKLEQAKENLSEAVSKITNSSVQEDVEQKIKDATEEVNVALKKLMEGMSEKQPEATEKDDFVKKEVVENIKSAVDSNVCNAGNKIDVSSKKAVDISETVENKLDQPKQELGEKNTSIIDTAKNAGAAGSQLLQDLQQKSEEIQSKVEEVKTVAAEKIDSQKNTYESQGTNEQKINGTKESINLKNNQEIQEQPKPSKTANNAVKELIQDGSQKLGDMAQKVEKKLEDGENLIEKINPMAVSSNSQSEQKPEGAVAEKVAEAFNMSEEEMKATIGKAESSLKSSIGDTAKEVQQKTQCITEEVLSKAQGLVGEAFEKKDSVLTEATDNITGSQQK